MTRSRFYFDTGVKPGSGSKLHEGQEWRRGTKQIPFECDDVPENSHFLFGSANTDHPMAKHDGIIIRKIHNSTLVAKYAYFRVHRDQIEKAKK